MHVLTVFFLLATAFPTTFVDQPLEKRVQDAAVVVRGVIRRNEAAWSQEGKNRQIATFSEMEIDEVFKGSLPDQKIMIRQPGGEKDGIGLAVPGAAKFREGEEVLLLLNPANADQTYSVHGLENGKFSIQRDENGEEQIIGVIESISQSLDEKWNISKLRKFLQSQNVPASSPNPRPVTARMTKPVVNPSSAKSLLPASPLQIKESQQDSRPGWWGFWRWYLGFIAALLIVFLMRQQKK